MCCTSPETANKYCLAAGTAAGNKHENHPTEAPHNHHSQSPMSWLPHASGHDDANCQCHSAVAQGGWSRAAIRRYSQGTRAVFVFFLERVGKAAAACCDQGSSEPEHHSH